MSGSFVGWLGGTNFLDKTSHLSLSHAQIMHTGLETSDSFCKFVFVLIFGFSELQIDENVQREIINHRSLRHPNIVRFKEVCLVCCSLFYVY